MFQSNDNFEWWSRGVADGIEAALACAQTALSVVAETHDSGDLERARMLLSVYQGLLSPDRHRRGADGRIAAIELFIEDEYVDTRRRRAQGRPGNPPDDGSRD